MTRQQRIALAMWGRQPARNVPDAMTFDWADYVETARREIVDAPSPLAAPLLEYPSFIQAALDYYTGGTAGTPCA